MIGSKFFVLHLFVVSAVRGSIFSYFLDDNVCSDVPDNSVVLKPYENTCRWYWQCDGKQSSLKSCSPHLHYNHEHQFCDLINVVDCPASSTITPDPSTPAPDPNTSPPPLVVDDSRCDGNYYGVKYYPHADSCSKFIECNYQVALEMDCPEGLYFTVNKERCVQPSDSECGGNTMTTDSTMTTSLSPCYDVSEGEVVLKRYEDTCRWYWVCEGQKASLKSCPPNLQYRENHQFCDFHLIAWCFEGSTPVPDPNTPPPDPATPPTPDFSDDPRCQNNGGVSYYTHPTDCSKFIECDYEVGFEMNCPEGLHFTTDGDRCVVPSEANCALSTTPTTVTTDTPTTETPTTTPTTTTTDSSMCHADEIDYFPHPDDCSKYIWCYLGSTYVMECPEGKWFSASEKKCVDPVVSGCVATSEPPWTTPGNECGDVPPGQIVLRRCSCGCMFYWECNGPEQTLRECPDRLYFDENRQFCAGFVNCDDQTRTPYPWTTTFSPITVTNPDIDDPRCSGQDDLYLPVPDCSKFVQCTLGWSYLRDCPSGLYFSSSQQICVQPSDADCGEFTTFSN